jgi:hypothetical protein
MMLDGIVAPTGPYDKGILVDRWTIVPEFVI